MGGGHTALLQKICRLPSDREHDSLALHSLTLITLWKMEVLHDQTVCADLVNGWGAGSRRPSRNKKQQELSQVAKMKTSL